MANDCDFALVIWDGKSKGSENNIKRILNLNKKHNFFINGSLNGRRDKHVPGAVLFSTLDIVLIEKTLD